MEDGSKQLIALNEAFEKALKAQQVKQAQEDLLREDWKQFNVQIKKAWGTLGIRPYKVTVQGTEVALSDQGIEGFFDDFNIVPNRETFDYLVDLATTYLTDYANLLK